MRAQALKQRQSEPVLLFSLAYAVIAAFVAQLVIETHPSFFLPVGIAALPFAAQPRQVLRYRILASVLLLAFLFTVERAAALLFAPVLAGTLLATFRALPRPERRGKRS